MKKIISSVFVCLSLLVTAGPTWATSLNYSLATGNGTQYGSSIGNVIEFIDQGVLLSTSAWANRGSDILGAATVTQSMDGLGACHAGFNNPSVCEQANGHRPIENKGNGKQDWLLLFFPETVSLDEIVINSVGNHDRDVTYWIGDLLNPAQLSGAELGDLSSLGFGPALTLFNSPGNDPLTVGLGGQTGNALLVGARLGDQDDRFWLSSLTATVVPISPAIWLFGSALSLLMVSRRRC